MPSTRNRRAPKLPLESDFMINLPRSKKAKISMLSQPSKNGSKALRSSRSNAFVPQSLMGPQISLVRSDRRGLPSASASAPAVFDGEVRQELPLDGGADPLRTDLLGATGDAPSFGTSSDVDG